MSDIEHTELQVWNIDLADSYPNLAEDEKQVLRYILKQKGPQSVNEIRQATDITDYRIRKIISGLIDDDLIEKEGNGPFTKYNIASDSVERLTQLQIKMEQLKKELANNI